MERLYALKQPLNDSHVSTSSNLGYETAMDFSGCSSNYYSMSDRTLEAGDSGDQLTIGDMDVDHFVVTDAVHTTTNNPNVSANILTPIAENHRAMTSTPMLEDSIAMNKSSLSTKTVKRNLSKIADVSEMHVDMFDEHTVEEAKDEMKSPMANKSIPTTKDSPVIPGKENSVPNLIATKLFVKNLRTSIANTVRRQSPRGDQKMDKKPAFPRDLEVDECKYFCLF